MARTDQSTTAPMDQEGILLVFADGSVGGTSRSALQCVRSWRSAGHPVVVLAAVRPAHGRAVPDDPGVTVVPGLAEVPWERIGLVHLHHWNWALDERARTARLVDVVRALPHPPRLLTNNIFSAPDGPLHGWPAPMGVGVLGRWSAAQYCTAMAGRAHPRPFVIGNPQDTGFFRPPTPEERAAARERLGVGPGPVVLRAGSPLANKWSPSYRRLARMAADAGCTTVLVSPPADLRAALDGAPGVRLVERITDDTLVRDWYWGADVFALDARRGESFGNVVTEALLTGLPVVYRGRPLRDNTPWEFRDLPGFTYVEGEARWTRRCLAVARRGRAGVDVARTRALVEDRYGVAAVGRLLDDAYRRIVAAPADRHLVDAPATPSGMSRRQRAAVAVRHNPIAALAKVGVNRLRTTGAAAGIDLGRLRARMGRR